MSDGDDTTLGLSAELAIGLTRSLNRWSDAADRHLEALQRYAPVTREEPHHVTINASGDDALIQLGSPDEGTQWEVQNWVVGGLDFEITAAGSAGLYVLAMQSSLTTGGTVNLRDFTTTMPLARFYGRHDIVLNAGEHLVTRIHGGTANQVYVARVAIMVYDVRAALGIRV